MAAPFRRVTLARARAMIADALLPGQVPRRLGDVLLAPHQVRAAARLAHLLVARGGALLADDVGLGKTFCALAVAAGYRRVLVLHPAALRPMWSAALARTGVGAVLASYESLSRGDEPDRSWDLVILDEAHHARSTTARRYPLIAAACAAAHTLLLTATPLPNRRAELESLFALFLGERATRLDDAELRELVVRRRHASLPSVRLPSVDPPRWVEVADDAASLDLITRLPPPLAPVDGGDAGALLTWSLVRRWASSRAALRATLRRQLARSVAMQDVIEHGRMPSLGELAAWTCADDAVQMALPGVCSAPFDGRTTPALDDALAIVRNHAEGVRRLLAHLRDTEDLDDQRAAALRTLRAAHPGEKVLAFSEFAETVHAYWQRLKRDPGVGRLTARGGEIASGPLPREQMLHLFAPDGTGRAPPRSSEAVSLLVTTDLLAEGVDLRDATVIVHLDLPWSPARLEQRVGRARRLGSAARRIAVHAMRPPAPAESLLALERRLRAKARSARITIGGSDRVLPESEAEGVPDDGSAADPRSPAERMSAVMDLIAGWGSGDPREPSDRSWARGCALALAPATAEGCLALVRVAGEERLVAASGGDVSDALEDIEAAVLVVDRAANGVRRGVPSSARRQRTSARTMGLHETRAARWYEAVRTWMAERAGDVAIGPVSERRSGLAERLLARVAGAWMEVPLERRAAVATQVESVRAMATSRLPAGILDEIDALVSDRSLTAEAWFRAAHRIAAHRDTAQGRPRTPLPDGVLALVVFSPDPAATAPVSATPS